MATYTKPEFIGGAFALKMAGTEDAVTLNLNDIAAIAPERRMAIIDIFFIGGGKVTVSDAANGEAERLTASWIAFRDRKPPFTREFNYGADQCPSQ